MNIVAHCLSVFHLLSSPSPRGWQAATTCCTDFANSTDFSTENLFSHAQLAKCFTLATSSAQVKPVPIKCHLSLKTVAAPCD